MLLVHAQSSGSRPSLSERQIALRNSVKVEGRSRVRARLVGPGRTSKALADPETSVSDRRARAALRGIRGDILERKLELRVSEE